MDLFCKARHCRAFVYAALRYTSQTFSSELRKLLIFLITVLRPLVGPSGCCRYSITCTRFAKNKLLNEPILYKALGAILWRVLCCNPFNRNTCSK